MRLLIEGYLLGGELACVLVLATCGQCPVLWCSVQRCASAFVRCLCHGAQCSTVRVRSSGAMVSCAVRRCAGAFGRFSAVRSFDASPLARS